MSDLINHDETIVAIATPQGRGGIGVVRLSGPRALEIAELMLRGKHPLAPGHASFCELIDVANDHSNNGRLDDVVATYFRSPQSYTKEDVVEISAHGSPVLLEHIVRQAIACGARPAEPGEFTRRAFLNGRINLTQAEAVRDLIEAQTLYQAKLAAQQLGGALSRRVAPIKRKLVDLIAVLEAGIDFADDDVSVLSAPRILEQIAEVRADLGRLLASFRLGHVVHQGITLAIVGRPNVGKSSIFNCLIERERAIVTEVPGTTRDLVSETIALHGVPVRLVDTAGIRESEEVELVERMGIERSYEALADADLVLLVFDASQAWAGEEERLLARLHERAPLLVANKSDLATTGGARIESVRTSARTGEGIGELRELIWRRVTGSGDAGAELESGALTNARHEQLVRESLAALNAAQTATGNKIPHEMLLMDLYAALHALDALTGETTPDDILTIIFSSFCIGK
ncbi:MAG: tRNA uridine-5-carboxymethylaminomethyl(34) synthesis GTPase MnmE [Acidobacteriaceae bacterium]